MRSLDTCALINPDEAHSLMRIRVGVCRIETQPGIRIHYMRTRDSTMAYITKAYLVECQLTKKQWIGLGRRDIMHYLHGMSFWLGNTNIGLSGVYAN